MLMIRRVVGLSMVPVYTHGNIVVGWRFVRPRIGDVVIAKHHRLEIIKRVDKMQDDRVFLLGDNPGESTDSRQFGWLPLTAIMAVVIAARRRHG